MKKTLLKTTISALTLLYMAGPATAQTVIERTQTYIVEEPAVIPLPPPAPGETITTTTRTMVTPKPVDALRVNFDAFDRNRNGILSMDEVGEHLFYLFDTDGNEVIDNVEFYNKRIITIAPMEKHTLKMVDVENPAGTVTSSTYNYETFYSTSGLTRFDSDLDGLSPAEFIDSSFLKLDTDNSKAIELDEWKSAYALSRTPLAARQDNYNN